MISAADRARMETLHADSVDWIVFHHAESAGDISAAAIDRIHRKERGWAAIGYHFVIRRNGTVELGRPVTKVGAHVHGLNHRSLGIVFSGNLDVTPPTPEQWASAADLGARLVRIYHVPLDHVIGHRDVNLLVSAGVVPVESQGEPNRTAKSCPGTRISIRRLRAAIETLLFPPPQPSQASPPEPEALDRAA